jgi:hypothetical protein
MWSRLTIMVLASAALMQGAAWGQDTRTDQDLNQVLPQKIREKLTEQGFKDVKVNPGSFVVSAKDQDGNRVVFMIGPTETTMMTLPDENPSQAQVPDSGKDQIIQQ